ncbi:hypothetical protein An08g07140 [Aspergillus niger]|uniref:Uncharacterized protein n=2 Tax=Aspergillus niger TaxID=5061 RepID=A2QRT3_ASPNC|nr:hypothetical protein An08g07140 [Aspergillus niger]CAK39961.1 hypothetical protein An08g07140 [Aspergillus niger]
MNKHQRSTYYVLAYRQAQLAYKAGLGTAPPRMCQAQRAPSRTAHVSNRPPWPCRARDNSLCRPRRMLGAFHRARVRGDGGWSGWQRHCMPRLAYRLPTHYEPRPRIHHTEAAMLIG